ncbi:MAG: SOS response-associated peptidase [Salibacteraceae bacterium]
MCGRYSISKSTQQLIEQFDAIFEEDFAPNFNAAPSQLLPVLRQSDQRYFELLRWGLIPFWAKDHRIGYKMINARSETVAEKPAFRNLLPHNRCIVPAEGYYEWKPTASGKVPHYIHLKSTGVFGMAGLWTTWKNKEQQPVHSFTILTCAANPEVTHIHDRMPVILPPEQQRLWLDPDLPLSQLNELMVSFPGDAMDYYTVSKAVNTPRNNDPRLLDHVHYDQPSPGLFD